MIFIIITDTYDPPPEGDTSLWCSTLTVIIHIIGDNILDVDEIDGISSNSEDFIPLPPKRGVILKSLGDPTKFLRGRQDRIYMGNDSTNPQG